MVIWLCPPKAAPLFLSYFSLNFASLPFPWLAAVQIYPLEFTLWEDHRGWSLFSTRNGGHRKTSMPQSPIGSYSVSEAQLTVWKWARKDCNLLTTKSVSGWQVQGDTLEKPKGPEVLSWIYDIQLNSTPFFSSVKMSWAECFLKFLQFNNIH